MCLDDHIEILDLQMLVLSQIEGVTVDTFREPELARMHCQELLANTKDLILLVTDFDLNGFATTGLDVATDLKVYAAFQKALTRFRVILMSSIAAEPDLVFNECIQKPARREMIHESVLRQMTAMRQEAATTA